MAADVAIRIEPGADVSRALVVVGAPAFGLVGPIVARHLVRSLGMMPVGVVASASFPPIWPVVGGRVQPPVRIYSAPADCQRGVACSRLVVVASELPLPAALAQRFCDAVAAWAKASGAPMVVVPDGLSPDGDDVIDVCSAASSDEGLAFLRALGVPLLEDGVVGGFAGALLAAGERAGVPVVSILGELQPDRPDARAAAAVVSYLRRTLAGPELDPAPLLQEAEAIEGAVREMGERLRRGAAEAEATPMFR